MRQIRRLPHILYTWLIIGLGFWLLYYFFSQLNLDLSRELLIMIAFGVLAEWLAVVFPQGQLSGGFAVVLATFLIYGPLPAAWVIALATAVGQGVVNRGNPLRTTLFNAFQYVLVVLGANVLYILAGGATNRSLSWSNALPLAVFVLTYFILNQFMVYIYTSPKRDEYPPFEWRDAMKWDGITYLLTVPIGLLMTLIYTYIGIYATILLFLPMLAVQFVMIFYVRLALVNSKLRVLYEVARRLGGSLQLQEILDLVLSETKRVINFHTGTIYLWSQERDCYYVGAVTGPYADLIRDAQVRRGEGFLGLAVEHAKPQLVDDTRLDVRTADEIGLTQVYRSMVVVPLWAETEVLGLLVLGDKRVGSFGEQHLKILTIIGGQAAVAIAYVHLQRKLEESLVTDGLTGLKNYHYFYYQAIGEIKRADRCGDNFSLIMIDIDHFKQVNDKYGHLTGNVLLTQVAQIIRSEVRSCDITARYGGEEFAVLMPQTGPNEALHVAKLLCRVIREQWFEVNERRMSLHISAGVVTYPDHAANLDALLKSADAALRMAKEAGGDRVGHT